MMAPVYIHPITFWCIIVMAILDGFGWGAAAVQHGWVQ